MNRVVVVGGGAAGLMSAVSAAQAGAKVTIIEKMPKIGRKLLITGKGRCNITNVCDTPTFIKNMPGNGAFLYSALKQFNYQDMIDFLQQQGVRTKTERGGRVFPVSDKAQDVVNAFTLAVNKLNINLLTGKKVTDILKTDTGISEIIFDYTHSLECDSLIIATGGASYPGTGSSGDGYLLAAKLGHTVTPLRPSLVPLEVYEDWINELQGLSLKNVKATVKAGDKIVAEEFGEMLFTHYGVSGPIILTLSKTVAQLFDEQHNEILLCINLKPALSEEVLDQRIQRDFAQYSRKCLKNALDDLLPQKLINVIIDLSFLDPDKPVHQVTKVERYRLLEQLRKLTLTIKQTRPVSEAIVTAGGVAIKEIEPSTMKSKIVRNLFFAGEVIDIDGYTGGFNLQAAFSTGYVAGKNAAFISPV